jgi:peptidoglycan/LPS O-acetylase OafA/YrhL
MHHGKFGKMNNFHFIRLFASIMVVFSHSFYLFSLQSKDPLHQFSGGIFTFGNLGVYIFLIVSGFLITQSILNTTSILNFIWRRFIRIFPALWVMVIISVFILGPLISKDSTQTYFNNYTNYDFLKNLFLFIPNNFKIPSIFEYNPIGTFNGCLWTIGYEVFFYLLLIVVFITKILKFRFLLLFQWLSFIIIQFYLGNKIYIYSYSSPMILNLNIEHCFRLFIFFESGVLLYLFKDIFKIKKFNLILLFYILFVIIAFRISNLTLDLILPVGIIYFAISNNVFSFIEKYGDYSYGIYLYGYIVQQYIVSLKVGFMNEYLLFVFSILLSLTLAYFSWHFIEKPALKLKNFIK